MRNSMLEAPRVDLDSFFLTTGVTARWTSEDARSHNHKLIAVGRELSASRASRPRHTICRARLNSVILAAHPVAAIIRGESRTVSPLDWVKT